MLDPFEINEGCTALLTTTLYDETDTPIPYADLLSLTLHLYDQATDLASPGSTTAVLNGRNRSDILSSTSSGASAGPKDGGIVYDTGFVSITLSSSDNDMKDTDKYVERHVALLEWSYGSSDSPSWGREEFLLDIQNMNQVT